MAKKVAKKVGANSDGRTLFVASPLSSRDTLICEIVRITNTVFGTDHNYNALYIAGLGAMTRRRVVAQYAVVIEAARAAHWIIVVLRSSPFDALDL